MYLIATPIGSARDITLRSLDVLTSVDVIAAEDTRTARKLLEIHGIPLNGRPVIAYHDHNGNQARPRIMGHLAAGRTVAYMSEAGTPLIADPGYDLVDAVRGEGYALHGLPGPSAVIAALAIGGMPTDRFFFAGFAPPQDAAREKTLLGLADVDATLVFYESPHRLGAFLGQVSKTMGPDRRVTICREITKKFEEVIQGTAQSLADEFQETRPKGEIVVLIDRRREEKSDEQAVEAALINAMLTHRVKDASDIVAGAFNLPRRDVYQMALKLKG